MDEYVALSISGRELNSLAASTDRNDRITAANEVQTLAELKRTGQVDFVVTCIKDPDVREDGSAFVRCFSMCGGEVGALTVPSDKPFGAWLGAQLKVTMGSELPGRLVLVSQDGQLLWEDEALEIHRVLKTLVGDMDQEVVVAAVAALVALISADDGKLSGLAIEELYRLVLRGTIPDMEVIAGAFDAIQAAAQRGSQPAVGVFVESLFHSEPKVRLFAVVGLEAPAKAGEERAVSALLRSINDENAEVRMMALHGLESLLVAVEEGSEKARASLAGQAETLLQVVKRSSPVEVIVALGAAAGSGHALALETLLQFAQEPDDEEIACSAVRGLGIAAMRGSPELCTALTSLAESNEDDGIRLQAVGSMGAMVKDGNMRSLQVW